jgi:hypothetical protein
MNCQQLEELRNRVDHRATEMRETGTRRCASNGADRPPPLA